MGFSTAEALLRAGFNVTITARSKEKGEEAIKSLSALGPVKYIIMDNNDLASVASAASSLSEPALDVLVNNAGIMNTPFALTKDGFEAQYQVNHLSHFLLVHLLFPKLAAAQGGGRVVNLASRAHMRHPGPIDYALLKSTNAQNYDGWQAYGRSKLSNILCAKAWAKRFPVQSSGIAFFSLHPGLVATDLQSISIVIFSQRNRKENTTGRCFSY